MRLIPVLLYHSVHSPRAAPIDGLAVSRERFESHLRVIGGSGRVPLTISEIAAGIRGERPLPERPLGITFDDGYEDTPAALDLVCGAGLRASLFVTTGGIGSPGMLRRFQLERLAAMPEHVEIGAHSVSHPHLDLLSPAALARELGHSKARLEQLTGREAGSFAYPYGSHDRRVRAAMIAAGFKAAAAVKNAISHSEDDPWAIARWTVRGGTSDARVAQLLEGTGAPLSWPGERLRTRGYRRVRRLRRAGGGWR